MPNLIKPPAKFAGVGKYTIFLAGTIDMGEALDWQKMVEESLSNYGEELTILNPRRDEWDSSWEQSIDNPQFKEQVTWELDGQKAADLIIFVFAINEEEAKKAKAPITLLELGMFHNKQAVVCCPKGFYRKGNVDIVCERFGIPVYEDFEAMLDDVAHAISEAGIR
jgi:Nucleoside 2-deoxyribosyltransferase like